MSTSKNRRPKPAADQYKRGYANGIRAAIEALFDDLEETGAMDGEAINPGDGLYEECTGCLLRARNFRRLADRLEFAAGISPHEAPPDGAPS